jgi:cytidylate kinase
MDRLWVGLQMTVWTISALAGTGGDRIASNLAASAGVPLLDRQTLARFAHELNPDVLEVEDIEKIEERFGGRLRMLALSMGMTTSSVAAAALPEIQLRQKLPELGRALFNEVARQPCVILSPAAFAVLPEHPGAIHVRLHAPLETRIAAYQREHLVDRAHAEKAISRDDHVKSDLVRSLYHVKLDDDRRFALVLDTSRFSSERLVEILLAAGGKEAPAT